MAAASPAAPKRTPFASHGILFSARAANGAPDACTDPSYFSDLNLDQVIDSITSGREEYALRPLLCAPLENVDDVRYRHLVFQDLEDAAVLDNIRCFSQSMQDMRQHLTQATKLRNSHQRCRRFLEAVKLYADALLQLNQHLTRSSIRSPGLEGLREYLSSYVESPTFTSLLAETRALLDALAQIRYSIHVKAGRVTVRKYDSEPDYSQEVNKVFDRFRQSAVHEHRFQFSNPLEMNQVEGNVLDLVARLYGDTFSALEAYSANHQEYLDEVIVQFDREVQFYLAFLEHMKPFTASGLFFCYPEVSRQTKEVFAKDTFDLALAKNLDAGRSPIVCNDFHLSDPERILVVSGPNQGGKTTFARTVGQLHHLASIGYPVPGRRARLFLFDRLFTHFPGEEDHADLVGQLESDLVRIRDILTQATPHSIIIINEIFSSTTVNDAILLGTRVMERLVKLDLLCVYVTFLDELASFGETTVSMMSTVNPESPADRTYKVVRKPADGLAYALALAERHGVTYEHLRKRIGA